MKMLNRNLTAAALLFLALLPCLALADPKTEAYQFTKVGVEAAKNKQWDKAIDNFRKAVKADPKTAANHNNLGLAYKSAGKLDDALKAFSDAIQIDPNESAAYINRGIVYSSQNKFDEAIKDFDRALKLKPDSVPAHRFRAFAYLQTKEYQKAIDDYNIVLREKENDLEILDRRAFALWNLKQYDKAIDDYTTIIKAKPNDKDGYLRRSYVYELKGDTANGLADCDKVLSLDPGNAEAKARKARLEYKKDAARATPTPTARPRRTLPPESPATSKKAKVSPTPGS
jgi:tetratricopeptide (TPR) repeat protein